MEIEKAALTFVPICDRASVFHPKSELSKIYWC